MNKTETRKLLSMLRAQYQHKFIIDDMTELVWHGLLNEDPELPSEAVFKASMTWMRDNEWPPQVRDLRDIIATKVTGIPTADEAWNQLSERIRITYPGIPNDLPRLPDLIIATVKDIGGTHNIRNAKDTEEIRKRFIAAYSRRRLDAVQSSNVTEAWAKRDQIGPGGRVAIEGKVA